MNVSTLECINCRVLILSHITILLLFVNKNIFAIYKISCTNKKNIYRKNSLGLDKSYKGKFDKLNSQMNKLTNKHKNEIEQLKVGYIKFNKTIVFQKFKF